MENNNEKKERRISFAAEAASVFKYEKENQETTISSDDEFTADLTFDNSKQLSIFNEPTLINDFMNRDMKELVEESLVQHQEMESKEEIKTDKPQDVNKAPIVGNDKEVPLDVKDLEVTKEEIEEVNALSSKVRRSPRPKKSKRQSFSPFKRNNLKNTPVKKEKEQENDPNIPDSSILSNNSIDTTEIINTQKLKFMVPQTKKPKIDITELFASKGIMFLDIISFANTRRNTLSKTRKEVDLSKILFYKNFTSSRIKFFDEFVDNLKTKGEEYAREIEHFVDENEEVSEIILSDELGKTVKTKMLDARNIAKVKWYELRAKKELAFNEMIIQNKNRLQTKLTEVKSKYDADLESNDRVHGEIEELKNKINAIKEQLERNRNDKESLEKKTKDIEVYEGLNENLSKTVEDLKNKYNKNLLHRQIQENHVREIKKSIASLIGNMREVCVSEEQLNNLKNEYEKLCAIYDFTLKKVSRDFLCIVFLGFELEIGSKSEEYGVIQAKYKDSNNISGQFMEVYLRGLPSQSTLIATTRLSLGKICALCEFLDVLKNISLSNQVETSLKDGKLFIKVVLQNFKLCQSVELNLMINEKFDCVVSKDGETYLYSLMEDKDFLQIHVE